MSSDNLLSHVKFKNSRQVITDELMELLLLADPDPLIVQSYTHGLNTITAELDGELMGIAVLVLNQDEQFELKNIAVKPAYQSKGIAKLLIDQIKNAAREEGGSQLFVGTGNSSLNQLALYQKCGFRFHSINSNYFVDYQPPIFENGIRCLDMVMLLADI